MALPILVAGLPKTATAATLSATSGQRDAEIAAEDRNARQDVHHRRALRIAAEHQPGVGARRRHGRDAGARVERAVARGEEVIARRIGHPIGAQAAAAHLGPQRVHECLPDGSDAGGLARPAGEDDLDIGARPADATAGMGDAVGADGSARQIKRRTR